MKRSYAIVLGAACAAILIGLALFGTHAAALRVYMGQTESEGRAALDRQIDNVRDWLELYQILPAVYARAPDIQAALNPDATPERLLSVSETLQVLNDITGSADTYLLNREGLAIAASNWAEPDTFIGANYAFRPYFEEASQRRLGRYFALGTQSGKRGYYFSHAVGGGPEVEGVIVVKVGVEEIEQQMRLSVNEVLVTDRDGVIVLAGNPAWRLGALGPMTPEAAASIRGGDQFRGASLARVGIAQDGAAARAPADGEIVKAEADRSDAPVAEFLHLSKPMEIEGWTMHVLVATAPARAQALTATLFAASVLAALGFAAVAIWQRRRRLVEGLRAHERAQAKLERMVAERTTDLRRLNLELQAEIVERRQAEKDLRQAQEDLVQAGKLAALGQMSAALSHEFNQPLAAIRSYADNAIAFLNHDQPEPAEQNLGRIVRLTERMAELSKLMLNFSRRPRDAILPVDLLEVIGEAMNLLKGRFERAGVEPRLSAPEAPVLVLGGHVRLQHVVMNLLTNAIDALDGVGEPSLQVTVAAEGDAVTVVVSDNGPGIAPEALSKIFDPFFTTKDVGKGLGLGLSISYNIVKDFGGALHGENAPGGGARFVLKLRRADVMDSAAE